MNAFRYYSLPFCQVGSEKVQGENLGEVLAGDRITSIPYDVRFAELRGCETLCAIRPTEEELTKFAKAIKDLYVVNLISVSEVGSVAVCLHFPFIRLHLIVSRCMCRITFQGS